MAFLATLAIMHTGADGLHCAITMTSVTFL